MSDQRSDKLLFPCPSAPNADFVEAMAIVNSVHGNFIAEAVKRSGAHKFDTVSA